MTSPAIEVRELGKRFGAFTAVDALSFTVAPGEIFGLLGSNGAGKSTAIRMMCGLLTPTSGSIRILGIDPATDPEGVKCRIGYMTQRFSLYEDLTVSQNLRFFGGVYGLHGRSLADRRAWAIATAELADREDTLTAELPAGSKQRLALACALLHEPRVVFLDEPTGSVDPVSRRRFWALIDELARDGVTVLVTTHYLDEAEHCDRIAMMHAGRLVAAGSVSELKEVFAGRAVLEIACPRLLDALAVIERAAGVLEATVFGSRVHAVVDDPEVASRIAQALTADDNAPTRLERIVPSLEDVFIHYIAAGYAEGERGS